MRSKILNAPALLLGLALSMAAVAQDVPGPTPMGELDYAGRLLEGPYEASVPRPEDLLGFPVGQRTASPDQIARAVNAWAHASPRVRAFEYARSHEGRPLYYVAISSPANLGRLDEIRADITRLARPAGLSERQAEEIIDRLPATAWMAYSIHGNESSGADAALAAIYHLAASSAPEIRDLLDGMVVFIDPSQNPDGRARFMKIMEEVRGVSPNVDNQSLLHSGVWPYGRTNHYLFDLNRDFFFLVHPETRGRVEAINQWYPQIIIDGHEMGALDTFLFSPAREPINRHLPGFMSQWEARFAADIAADFDRRNWPYYHGEWNDNLFVGYSSYAAFRGSLFFLYEEARTAEDGVRLPQGSVRTYRESVHHQLQATMSNLFSLERHSGDMYRDFLADRRMAISADGPYADTSYVILASDNRSRFRAFAERLEAQDIEVWTNPSPLSLRNATDWTGKVLSSTTVPPGSLIVPNRQPEARLIAAILEFDAAIGDETLAKERQERLRNGGSIMYDTTAWNLEMMYGLRTLRVPDHIDSGVERYAAPASPRARTGPEDAIAWIVDGIDDASVAVAARLLERGLRVRAIDKPIELDGQSFSRGSVMVSVNDNRDRRSDLADLMGAVAGELGVTAAGITSGLGAGDLPDIGGRHFRLLERPRLAILSRHGTSPYSFGSIWHSVDKRLGIRHSHLDQATLGYSDLRRYNVLVLPDTLFSARLDARELEAIGTWVEAGGTLIAVDGAVSALIDKEQGMSAVRQLRDALPDLLTYDVSLQREWMSRAETLDDPAMVRSHVVPAEVPDPFPESANGADEDLLRQRDQWQALFMPQGAMLAGTVDERHWLSFGVEGILPVLFGNNPVLMSDDRSEAVVRLGALEASSAEEARRVGWATVPAGQDVRLRMSGLLWPEAAQRIAHSAYLTRERKGHGQIILFAAEPVFRGAALGTNRLLLNAIVYGPGLGATAPVMP